MVCSLIAAGAHSAVSAIPTAGEADTGFPVWVLATWGAGLAFALWVLYVVVREWRNDARAERIARLSELRRSTVVDFAGPGAKERKPAAEALAPNPHLRTQ